MRKIILGLGISIDGYIARPDGAFDFLFMPKDYSMAPLFERIDAGVMGRKTYEVNLQMGGFGPSMAAYVLSRSLPPGEQNGAVVMSSLAEIVRDIRSKPGKDVWLMGGGETVRECLREDLVDEMEIGVVPTLLGEGIPLFPSGFPQRDFTLTENKSYSKGLIVLKYERTRRKAKPRRAA